MLQTRIDNYHGNLLPTLLKSNPSPSIPLIEPSTTQGVRENISRRTIAKQRKLAVDIIDKWENPITLMQLADTHILRGDYDRAIKWYKKALKLDKSYYPVYRKLIFALLFKNKIDESKSTYEDWLKISDRSDIEHEYVLFKLFFYGEKKSEIEDCLLRLIKISKNEPQDDSVVNSIGFIYLNYKKGTKKSKKYFEKALKINPKQIHALNNYGVILLNEGNKKASIESFKKAIAIDAMYSSPYQNIANVFISKGDFNRALSVLLKAETKGVDLDIVWRSRIAWLYLKLNKPLEANKRYINLLKVLPNDSLLLNDLGVSFSRLKKYKEARKYFTASTRTFERSMKEGSLGQIRDIDLYCYYNLYRLARDEKNIKQMEEIIDKLSLISPHNYFALYGLGRRALGRQDYKNARRYYDQSLEKNDNFEDIYPDYSYLLESIQKDYKGAITFLKKGIKKGFKNALIDNNLAYAYLKIGEDKKAKKILDSYRIKSLAMWATRGLYFFNQGEIKKGNENFRKAFEKGKEDIVIQAWNYEKAVCYFKKAMYKKARQALAKAKEMPESYYLKDIKELEKGLKRKLPTPNL
jgi:tetratricopeptide (TPR) repeat protein